MTLQGIADRLNADGHTTRRQESWNKVQVMRVLKRAGHEMRPRGKQPASRKLA
jgi:hypothetical protein